MLDEISFLQTATKNISYESFIADEEKKRAISMTLINIGELARVLTDDLKNKATDIPFKEITATRNIAAHGYHALNFDYIWDTVKTDIPDLEKKVKALLKKNTSGI